MGVEEWEKWRLQLCANNTSVTSRYISDGVWKTAPLDYINPKRRYRGARFSFDRVEALIDRLQA